VIRARFAIPGDLHAPTGGYAYDRAVIAAAPAAGLALEHLPLPGGFPFPGDAAIAQAARQLAEAPADAPLLIDGLALGAMPEAALLAVAAPIAALLHHPLALEEGLTREQMAALESIEGAALRLAQVIITTSAATAETARAMFDLPADRFVVARPGWPRAEPARGGGSAPHLLTVGSLIPRKGHDVLIDALASIKGLEWRASFFGSDGMAPDWAAGLRGRIAAHGLQSRIALRGAAEAEILQAAYASADIFVLPSRYEGYGMVFAEAMANGLPIVCADIEAAREVIPDAAGLRAPVNDARSLADLLHALLDDPARRRAMASAAYAHAAAQPGWDATAQAIRGALAPLADRAAA
jgi:glycosyltransferase involved in cell wall biosynthesis